MKEINNLIIELQYWKHELSGERDHTKSRLHKPLKKKKKMLAPTTFFVVVSFCTFFQIKNEENSVKCSFDFMPQF